MCEMLNLFVPHAHPALGAPVSGFSFGDGGEIQKDFAARFAHERGVDAESEVGVVDAKTFVAAQVLDVS